MAHITARHVTGACGSTHISCKSPQYAVSSDVVGEPDGRDDPSPGTMMQSFVKRCEDLGGMGHRGGPVLPGMNTGILNLVPRFAAVSNSRLETGQQRVS